MPSGFSLEQNFPNPFNPVTTIQFSLIQSGFVSLKIYDVIGKEIATLINGDMNRGNHSIQWNAASPAERRILQRRIRLWRIFLSTAKRIFQ